jgi:hypothetical protein
MTTLFERFTTPAEPEEGIVTQPRRPSGRPFWTGIPGLDPGIPAPADRELAARIAAEACAVHMHGMAATLKLPLRKPVAEKYLNWLLDAADDMEAWVRRYALRVTCDRAGEAEPGDILDAAWQTVAFVYPGRRR